MALCVHRIVWKRPHPKSQIYTTSKGFEGKTTFLKQLNRDISAKNFIFLQFLLTFLTSFLSTSFILVQKFRWNISNRTVSYTH